MDQRLHNRAGEDSTGSPTRSHGEVGTGGLSYICNVYVKKANIFDSRRLIFTNLGRNFDCSVCLVPSLDLQCLDSALAHVNPR